MTGVVPIRDAATVILVRDAHTSPAVLMGQRGKGAAFLPDKYVFPGGAVDDADAAVPIAQPLPRDTEDRLARHATAATPNALAAAAIRELWEETGLRLGAPCQTRGAAPDGWHDFDALPSAAHLNFFFRAITPAGRPRRFDARFFLVPAEALIDDPDGHPPATDELANLAWMPLDQARQLNIAFVTGLVLAELANHLPRLDAPERIPFIKNDEIDHKVIWL